MEHAETESDAYEGLAVVELMGHRVIAGNVREVTQFGAPMLRVDIVRPGIVDESKPITAITQYYGGSAIYCLTPCDEATALRVNRRTYDKPEIIAAALPAPVENDGF